MEEREGRELLVKSGLRLVEAGLTSGTWGNLSLRLSEEKMLVTPSGKEYVKIRPEDLTLVDIYTEEWSGPKPSSEFKLHTAVYRERREIGAVIHNHSPNASVVAAARREVPPVLDDLAQLIGPTVRVADYALPSTKAIVKKTMKALKGRNGALMANHGAICLGRDMEEAFTCCEVLDKGCKAFVEAEFLGGAKFINRFEAALMHQIYLKKYSKLRTS
ncbi:MAG: class II aldolase/adducin family protein [Spirochaetales bacterium]|nr:class II aldolase/adducin family protein [Spirochaetales bacterium]